MKVYAYMAIILVIVGAISWTHYAAYKSGQDSITEKLKNDRITILKDGAKIDENVINSGDDELTCLLLDNCKPE